MPFPTNYIRLFFGWGRVIAVVIFRIIKVNVVAYLGGGMMFYKKTIIAYCVYI
jgi:hypothetical protein